MIWKKHEEHYLENNSILIITNYKNKEDGFILNRVSMYKSKGYNVKIKYNEE